MANYILKLGSSFIREGQFPDAKVIVQSLLLESNLQIDIWMDNLVRNELTLPYTNIFIPLSFGHALTDFLGLRLALYIRSTYYSTNKNANIYIYSALTIEEIPKETELLQVLLTEGTTLIDYSLEEIRHYSKTTDRILSEKQLTQVLNTINLKVPENFYDNHSIANIWGIFRLLRTAGIPPNTIESVQNQQDKLNGLYFKWLLAKEQYNWQALSPEQIPAATTSPAIIKDILLIDDESKNGWEDALIKAFKIPAGKLAIASNMEAAIQLLSNRSFQLIFLDLRLGEKDHATKELQNMGGYQLLTKHIRNNFKSKNFATPVILLTASSKAWNINTLLNEGADDYYIKEAPEQANNNSFSEENFRRLLYAFDRLMIEEKKRREIWEFSNIVETLTNKNIQNENIRHRISEKLRIGFGLLFRNSTQVEIKVLLSNNETLAFLAFWSILEEISHDFYDRSRAYTWELKKTGRKLQLPDPDEEDKIKTFFKTIRESKNNPKSLEKGEIGFVNLSDQISAILRYQANWNHNRIIENFMKPLNNFRNEIDFIHTNETAILSGRLANNQNNEYVFKKCKIMLKLLITLLS